MPGAARPRGAGDDADGLRDEDIRMAMMTPCRDIEATLGELVARYGPRLCVLSQGPMTIPYLK